MKGTYQPFILKIVDKVFEILHEEINPSDKNKEELCKILTQKFIDGELNDSMGAEGVFKTEEELHQFVNLCIVNDDLEELYKKGFVSSYNDGETYFLTPKGTQYVEKNLLGG